MLMLRLVAYAHNGVQRFAVDRAEMVIGSEAGCDIRLPFAGVGGTHARLTAEGDALAIEDLGTRKGLLVNGRRTRAATLQVLDEIRLGSISLLVEDVTPEPVSQPEAAEDEPAPEPTITAQSFLDHMAGISRWVRSDAATNRTLESVVNRMLDDLGGGVLFLFQGEADSRSIKFVVATEARWLVAGETLLGQVVAEGEPVPGEGGTHDGSLDGHPAWISFHAYHALERRYLFVVALPRFRPTSFSPQPGFETMGDLLILGLVHHVGQFQPIVFGHPTQADLTLAPSLVIGESKAMQRVLAQLKVAVDPPVTALLRGEPGVSKELLARSLHLSGPHRDGPFVTASCVGARAQTLASDLFGAEVEGPKGTIVRVGKIASAAGGTLFLDDVEELPFELQSRLVRFLRAGEVEPEGSVIAEAVEVRLIVGAQAPLERFVARDQFRLDLAHRLGQFAIDVPALRERREDLPLLIQAAINRCCHAAGKRVQGITVKALEALAVYDYPGNLPELENIVRRLVYLCPQGMPIDESMLPEAVRRATVEGLQPSLDGDLDLERLVASCERAAIREALHRSAGNKSEAARQLRLSRNGLTMKIKRLGLKV